MRSMLLTTAICLLAFGPSAVAADADFSDFVGSWGMQSGAGGGSEWRMNCAQNANILVLTPSRIYTRGSALVYKEYADCQVLNGSSGAALLIHAHCASGDTDEDAENVMLEFAILSPEEPLRIQRRGEVSTEYHKCR